jgi:hypothetical protein
VRVLFVGLEALVLVLVLVLELELVLVLVGALWASEVCLCGLRLQYGSINLECKWNTVDKHTGASEMQPKD